MKEIDISSIQEMYKDNIKLIQEEIDITEDFYDELKIHFDRIKNSTSSGALNFISKQTPNLVSLRNNKITLLKEMNQITRNIIDETIKLSANEEEGLDKDSLVLKELHNMLLENKPEVYLEKIKEKEDLKDDKEEPDYDLLLEERLEDIENNKPKEEPKEQKKKKNKNHIKYKIVVDEERNLYVIDDDYNILDDSDELIPNDWVIDFLEDDDGNIISAINQDNEEIEVISFDEEDE